MRRYVDAGGIIRWDKTEDRYVPPIKPKPKPKPKPVKKKARPITRVARAKLVLNKFLKQWKGEVFTVKEFAEYSGYRQETARRILDRDGYSECYVKIGYRAERQYNTKECTRISNEAI